MATWLGGTLFMIIYGVLLFYGGFKIAKALIDKEMIFSAVIAGFTVVCYFAVLTGIAAVIARLIF